MTAGRRLLLTHVLLPLGIFAALALLFELTDLDGAISDPFYDAAAGVFPGRRAFWAEELLHTGGHRLVFGIGLGAFALGLLSFAHAGLARWRRAAFYLGLCIALCGGLVGLVKAYNPRYCPWDLERYGGFAPHLGLLERTPPGLRPGHCFPSAHAAGAFALFGLYFILGERSRRLAWVGLAVALALGTLFSLGQIARGAHFASHGLWTAMLCWLIALGLYRGPFRAALLPAARPAGKAASRNEATTESL